MADRQHLVEAAELKAAILKRAALRSKCWITGDVTTAGDLTMQLERDWQMWRAAAGAARGDDRRSYVPTNGTRSVQPSERPVDRFLKAVCVLDADAVATVSEVHTAYLAWAESEDDDAISPMRLTQELKRRGVETTRTKTARMYRGVRVTASAHMPLATA